MNEIQIFAILSLFFFSFTFFQSRKPGRKQAWYSFFRASVSTTFFRNQNKPLKIADWHTFWSNWLRPATMKIKQTFSRRNPVSYYSIYSPASDLLESLNREKVIKNCDESDAKGLRSVAPGRSSLIHTLYKVI